MLIFKGRKFWVNEVPESFKYDDQGKSYSSYFEDDIENFLKQDFDTEVDVNYVTGYIYEARFANPKHNILFEIKYNEYVIHDYGSISLWSYDYYRPT